MKHYAIFYRKYAIVYRHSRPPTRGQFPGSKFATEFDSELEAHNYIGRMAAIDVTDPEVNEYRINEVTE